MRALLGALARQHRVRVRLAHVRVVRASLPFEVDLRVALAAARGRRRAFARHYALVAGPGPDQGAVHRKMFVRQQSRRLGLLHDVPEQGAHRLVFDQPVAVGGEAGVIPHRRVHGNTDEPAVQQVVFQLFAQLPFAANAVQRLQHQPAQQFLRRDGVATAVGVHRVEVGVHGLERRVEQIANAPQRVNLGHKILQPLYREQRFLHDIGTAHRRAPYVFYRAIAFVQASVRRGRISTNC